LQAYSRRLHPNHPPPRPERSANQNPHSGHDGGTEHGVAKSDEPVTEGSDRAAPSQFSRDASDKVTNPPSMNKGRGWTGRETGT